MKAISLLQPWASLVVSGRKTIETRSWWTSHRGTLAIHASKGLPQDRIRLCFAGPFRAALLDSGIVLPRDLPLGAILGTCRLVECLRVGSDGLRAGLYARPLPGEPERSFGDYRPGRFAWLLEDVRPLPEPVPCKGSLGLWAVPVDVMARIEEGPARGR